MFWLVYLKMKEGLSELMTVKPKLNRLKGSRYAMTWDPHTGVPGAAGTVAQR